MADKLKAVIYCRVSTEMQKDEEIPILGQINECKKYAAERGWEIIDIYQDAGFHGWDETRPAFQEMVQAAKQTPRPFDIILVWRSNRLFRSTEHRLAYRRILRRSGVRFMSLHEPEFEGASGQFLETVMAAADELYAKQTGEDTLRGLKEIAKQGYSTGGRPPVGYKNVRKAAGLKTNGEPIMRTAWEVDKMKAPLVLKAFLMYSKGSSGPEIIRATGVVSAKNNLSTMLRNRAYIGERIYNTTRRTDKKTIRLKNKEEDIVRIPNAHPPIVPPRLFKKVQLILKQKQPHRDGHVVTTADYILSSLLWCKEHNCPMTGHSNGSTRYYSCARRKQTNKETVNCSWIKKEAVEKFVIDNLKNEIYTRERVRAGLEWMSKEKVKNLKEDTTERDDIKKELTKLDVELTRFQNAIAQGIPADSMVEPINQRLDQKKELEYRLAYLARQREREIKIPQITDAMVDEVLAKAHELLNATDPKELKIAVKHFIERIDVEGNKLTIHYTISNPNKIVLSGSDPGGLYAKGTIVFTINASLFPRHSNCNNISQEIKNGTALN